MKYHVNRTCFHAGLKSHTGMSSFRLSCERTLNEKESVRTLEDLANVAIAMKIYIDDDNKHIR